eukprot:13599912-Heterocapsa_arctica.AAC.1
MICASAICCVETQVANFGAMMPPASAMTAEVTMSKPSQSGLLGLRPTACSSAKMRRMISSMPTHCKPSSMS